MNKYEKWIADNVPAWPSGLCAKFTRKMQEAFPELRRVRGHINTGTYIQPHWWLETLEGEIVDPTSAQFPLIMEYVEYVGPEPKGKCMNCGKLTFGKYTDFCDDKCAKEAFEE